MVAIIKTSRSIHRILNYNENKVKDGVAECIGEGNYPIDSNHMNFNIKLNYLLKQLQLNENVSANSVHISLNFDPSESNLDNAKLMQIADDYMEKIGFGKQPYLVYRHYDAGHPHIHIVTVKVRRDGSRIDMHNIGRNQSEIARKEIERSFGLVVAEGRKIEKDYELKPISLAKVAYGKLQSKKAISTILNSVLSVYKYTSLPELNAVLQQYNVLADRGSENSRIFKANGLVYRILDEHGGPVGVPIKASDFYNRPTLKFLQQKFVENDSSRGFFKSRVKNAIGRALINKKVTLSELTKTLDKEGIHVILRKSESGALYGVTYVDHQTKCVFNGSTLGKTYTAKALQERCETEIASEQHLPLHAAPRQIGLQPPSKNTVAETKDYGNERQPGKSFEAANLIEDLMKVEPSGAEYVPGELKGKKKRKKKRNLNKGK